MQLISAARHLAIEYQKCVGLIKLDESYSDECNSFKAMMYFSSLNEPTQDSILVGHFSLKSKYSSLFFNENSSYFIKARLFFEKVEKLSSPNSQDLLSIWLADQLVGGLILSALKTNGFWCNELRRVQGQNIYQGSVSLLYKLVEFSNTFASTSQCIRLLKLRSQEVKLNPKVISQFTSLARNCLIKTNRQYPVISSKRTDVHSLPELEIDHYISKWVARALEESSYIYFLSSVSNGDTTIVGSVAISLDDRLGVSEDRWKMELGSAISSSRNEVDLPLDKFTSRYGMIKALLSLKPYGMPSLGVGYRLLVPALTAIREEGKIPILCVVLDEEFSIQAISLYTRLGGRFLGSTWDNGLDTERKVGYFVF